MSTTPSPDPVIVVGILADGSTWTNSYWHVSVEAAIQRHRGYNNHVTTIYALPLADFIKHATPEKREWKVTRKHTTVTYVRAATKEEAIAVAKFAATAEQYAHQYEAEVIS